jgi:hypothetical protein
VLDTIAYFVNSPAATFGFTYDFLSGDNQGDFFQVNVLHGGVATQLLLVPDSIATNNIATGGCVSAPDDTPVGTVVCGHTGLTTFTTAANALAAFNGQQVQFQFLVSDGGTTDDAAFDSAAVLDAINGTGLDVERLGASTPEPGTIFLAAGALAALALRKLRSQS